jgi:predicted benzoate:H+ symporter BenE
MAYKFWPLSPVAYLLSIPSKALTAAFLPMSIYFILRSNISKKQKMITAGITIGIILAGGIAGTSTTQGTEEEFDAKEFQMGFTSFAYQLRSDGLVMLFMIPLVVGLFIVSRNGIKHGESMMVFISGMLLIAPILTGFTNQTNQPYRFVPLVVFFAMGVGVLLSKRQT